MPDEPRPASHHPTPAFSSLVGALNTTGTSRASKQDIFILLLKKGADPNVAFEKSTLFNSTIEEDFHQFEEALLTHCRKTLDVNFTGKDQRTALMSAICTDAIENAVTLLGDPWNADPGLPSKDGEFPVHAAASLGHDRILELLGEKEASRPDGSPDKATPLMHAAQEGHVSSMETLVKLGADAKAVNTQVRGCPGQSAPDACATPRCLLTDTPVLLAGDDRAAHCDGRNQRN